MTRFLRIASPLISIVVVCALALSCAQERPPIDRVQPNALDKTFFVGTDLVDPSDDPEFWTMGTLIDVGYGASQDGLFTSTYAQPVSRIRWQITEDLLIGRLAYERVDGSDGKGIGDKTDEGVIVVAYEIEKHFDIVRQYNATTGEQLNVLEENTQDRPWYERAYMRVDWSRNQNVDSYDFDTLSLLGIYGSIEYESLSYDVTDPSDRHAPFFDEDGGYFDVTNKAFAKPKEIDLSAFGWGIDAFPACFLDADFMNGTFPAGSCSPVELTIRQSFRRVEDTDYEPKDWDGFRFQAYGAFTVERMGYARNYGMSDDMWHRFLTRYDIWERSHAYDDPEAMTGEVPCYTEETTPYGADPHRDQDQNGTEDECEAVTEAAGMAGSRCDIFRQRCTLPYGARQTVVIPWYYTEGSNPDFYRATEWATHEWDVALRAAARSAQRAECESTGAEDCAGRFPMYMGQQGDNVDAVALAREVDDCRSGLAYAGQDCDAVADEVGEDRGVDPGVIAVAKMPEMIVLCHSPVASDDHAACGQEGLTVRRGDLRYHQVNVMTEPQTPSPWGIYTDAEDPTTGQTISASINVWSHVNDLWSQSVVDVARYIAGELSTEDVTDGENIRNWVQAAAMAEGGGAAARMSREELGQRLAGFAGGSAEAAASGKTPALDPQVLAMAKQLKSELRGVAASVHANQTNRAVYSARRQHAHGTAFEAELMTPMMQELTGVTELPLTDAIMDLASPLRGALPSIQRDLSMWKEVALAERGACVLGEAPAPLAITGLADVLQEKFGAFDPKDDPGVQAERAERMRRYVAERAHYAVIVHEMGHSVGMRHNFVSSSDAWGYRPQYWQLRTRNGAVSNVCTDLVSDGKGCVGPRYFDPVTEEERDGLIWMFSHSSVMDYAGELAQDMIGLGVYDFAAVRMFYGDTVAVFSDASYKAGTPRSQGMLSKMDSFGGILGIQPQIGEDEIHYTELQDAYDLISDCEPVQDPEATFKPASWDEDTQGAWHAVLDGLIVEVNGTWSRCKQPKVAYVPWTSLRMPQGNETAGWYGGGVSIDPEGRTRVPYGFATDGWADVGNASVYRHDNGGDTYEIFNFLITQQEVGHIFDNYRRNRQGFSVRKAANRTLYRYNTKIRDGAKGLGLIRNIYEDFAIEVGYDFDTFWPSLAPLWFGDSILSASMVFDHFGRMLARPEHGPHYKPDGDNVLRSSRDTVANAGATQVIVPNGATGYYGNIGLGGRPVENQLASDKGEYDTWYTINAGSYYDKLSTAMLMTESIDNFISSSRTDFVDPRYRAVSLADLFPDGYRRWLSTNLTGDDGLKGPRISANFSGTPHTDGDFYPAEAIGWTSWWGDEPEICFPANGTTICSSYGALTDDPFDPKAPSNTAVLDPQVGWEQQKFLIAWTMLYLPENQKQEWIDMLRIWELGVDSDPGFANRIEFHHPSGKVYVAKTFGKETLFGKTVERGIAGRVLQYANELLAQAYVVSPGPDLDGDGDPDWYVPFVDPTTGQVLVKWDPTIQHIDEDGFLMPQGTLTCNGTNSKGCTCSSNRACVKLASYVSVPWYLREAVDAYGLGQPSQKGVY